LYNIGRSKGESEVDTLSMTIKSSRSIIYHKLELKNHKIVIDPNKSSMTNMLYQLKRDKIPLFALQDHNIECLDID